MHASQELLEHIGSRNVQYVQIKYEDDYSHPNMCLRIEGTLETVLPRLDFNYSSSYGRQNLYGTIWYTDGTWSDRGEYDGSEWWQYHQCPPLPEGANYE